MYITKVPNRNSSPAILLRESYRENGKVKNRTLANLTHMDPSTVEALKAILSRKSSPPYAPFQVVRSLPHGHAAVALHVAQDLGLPGILGSRACPERTLALALVLQRVLDPASKASSARALSEATATSSLPHLLDLPEVVSPDHVYGAMDWLVRRQRHIENRLAKKHLHNGCLVLYDLTSTWVEGSKCELAKRGYSRDGKKGKDQIEFALLTDKDGRPVSVEVFEGNVSDPATVAPMVRRLKDRFKLDKVVVVGDRGMLTSARIREDIAPEEGVQFVTALRKPSIRKLLDRKDIQLGLFDDVGLVEVESEEFPDSRLIACRNPYEAEAQRTRRQLRVNRAVSALYKVRQAIDRDRRPLRGRANIERRIGKVFGRHRGTEKYFTVSVSDDSLEYAIDAQAMSDEARLDGMYVTRTDVPRQEMAAPEVVRTYKSLAKVERSFRAMKSADLDVRPIFHRRADRVRAHVLLCMLALYVRHELEQRLAPMLYVDEEPGPSEDPVKASTKSSSARRKAARHADAEGRPIQSYRQAMRCLASWARTFIEVERGATGGFWTPAKPTEVQRALLKAAGLSV
jgi:hypothetical protein